MQFQSANRYRDKTILKFREHIKDKHFYPNNSRKSLWEVIEGFPGGFQIKGLGCSQSTFFGSSVLVLLLLISPLKVVLGVPNPFPLQAELYSSSDNHICILRRKL